MKQTQFMPKCAESSKTKVNRFMFGKVGIKIYLFTARVSVAVSLHIDKS